MCSPEREADKANKVCVNNDYSMRGLIRLALLSPVRVAERVSAVQCKSRIFNALPNLRFDCICLYLVVNRLNF